MNRFPWRVKWAQIHNTLAMLRSCIAARDAGAPVAFTGNPIWLINMAINRRAGWPDDPSPWRGSAMPVNGRYPKKAEGDAWNHLRRLAFEINTPRLIVRPGQLGMWRRLIMRRLPDRITTEE